MPRYNAPTLDAWTFSPREIDEARAGIRLLNPSLDLSNACNLNCTYCFAETDPNSRKRRRPSELSVMETLHLIDDFASAGARTVNLVGAGEPTLDPVFREVISRIHGHGMRTLLFTNGIAFDRVPGMIQWILERQVSVALKLNSHNAEVQDRLAGHDGYARIRDRALDLLLSAGFASGSPSRLALDVLVMREVLPELPELLAKCRRLNIYPIFAEYIPTGRTDGGVVPLGKHGAPFQLGHSRPSLHERQVLAAQLAKIDREYGVAQGEAEAAYFGGAPCTQVLGVYVDIQGLIWPCVAKQQKVAGGVQRQPLGSVRAGNSPSEVWRSSSYLRELRTSWSGRCPYKLPVPSSFATATALPAKATESTQGNPSCRQLPQSHG